MAFVAILGTIISGVVGAMGAMQQGAAAQASANYQAAVAQQNRMIAEQNAHFEELHGEQQAQTQGLKDKAAMGSIVAGEGASGLDITTGSKKSVIDSTQKLSTFNEALIRNDSARKAYDFRAQAFNYEAQSRLFTFQGENARTASNFQAFGSLLGSAASVGQRWYQFGGAPNIMGS
jgi:hypothetical protein